MTRLIFGALLLLTFTTTKTELASAAYCDGASHIGCYEGVDQSGRSPGGLYDAAVEGLKGAQTESQRALARKAKKDAFDPKMSNQRAVGCNRNPGAGRDFSACVASEGPAPGLRMTIECQQNLSDGRVLVDSRVLPAGAQHKVVRYHPTSTGGGWSHGTCEVEFPRK